MTIKTIIKKLTTTITGGAIIIAFFSVVSKVIGLLRDHMLASYFGAGDTLDIYYAAFKLPDLVFNTLVLGALSAAFIPVFVQVWEENKIQAWYITNSILNILVVLIGIVSVIVIIFADHIMPWVVPGFAADKLIQTVHITRIMFVSVIFFTISNVFSGILNSLRKFVAFSLAPILYNFGIIFGIIALYPLWGVDGLAWGVVLGSVFHMFIQLAPVLKTGWQYHLVFGLKNLDVRRILRLMIPRTFALGIGQVNQLVIVVIASTLAVGSITVFNLANNLQSLNIIGISFAIACFPVFSKTLSEKKFTEFQSIFSLNVRRIIYIMLPLSAAVFLLRMQIVRLVLGAGEFDWSATIATGQVLGYFTLSLVAQSLMPLITRVFYALEDTKTPVIISVLGFALNIALAIILSQQYAVAGLALAFSIASISQLLALLVWLRWKFVYLDAKRILRSASLVVFMSLLTSIFMYATLYAVAPLVNMQTYIGVATQTIATLFIGFIVYLALSFALAMEEVEVITSRLRKYFVFLKKMR